MQRVPDQIWYAWDFSIYVKLGPGFQILDPVNNMQYSKQIWLFICLSI